MITYDKVAIAVVGAVGTCALSFFAWNWKKEAERYKRMVENDKEYAEHLKTSNEVNKEYLKSAMLDVEIQKAKLEMTNLALDAMRSGDTDNGMGIAD